MIFAISKPQNFEETIIGINTLRSFVSELLYKLNIGKEVAENPLTFKVLRREVKFAYHKVGNRYIWLLFLDDKIVPTNPNWRPCSREDIVTYRDLKFIRDNYCRIVKKLISSVRKIAGKKKMKYKAYSNELIEVDIVE